MFTIDQTVLLVIDVQGKLARKMFGKEKLFRNLQALIKGAQILSIPILWTEQTPEKIGVTVPEFSRYLTNLRPIKKASFSCVLNRRFMRALRGLHRKQILVSGIETHVCVYQTAADLLEQKYQVQIVADAVSSRTKENRDIALARMQELGAGLTSVEMVMCELLRTSEHARFKKVLKLIK